MSTLPLILASGSKARQAILSKLRIPFTVIPPDIDESVFPDEQAEPHVQRLAQAKAQAVANKINTPALIIACDSVCVLGNQILSKPETFANARKQLELASGKCIYFYTGLCVLNTHTQKSHTIVDKILVEFRELDSDTIDHYLKLDQPLECAGSIHAEGLGIALIKKIQVDDPNSLVGLPLIKLIDLLKLENFTIL